MKSAIGLGFAALTALLMMFPNTTSLSEFNLDPKLIIDDQSIILEKKTITMHIPIDNKLPWGSVWGKVVNPVEEYPVIIQIYKDGKPVHRAQTDVKEDGSYEYKFRVRSVDGDQVINIFQGDYTVKIFKTVYVTPNASVV